MHSFSIKTALSLLIFVSEVFARKSKISVSRTSYGGTYAPGDLIFADEFDFFNTSLWQREINMNGGNNQEFQIYDDYSENSYVRDGILYIRPTLTLDTVFGGSMADLFNGNLSLEGCTDERGGEMCERQAVYPAIHPPIVSARLRTLGAFSFTYGRIEVRARYPSGDWTWPAIWLLPEENKYGPWPLSGEIDMMEARGNRKLFAEDGLWNIGAEQTAATLNYGTSLDNVPWWTAHGELNTAPDQGYDRDFHVFECEWTPSKLDFKVDGVQVVNVVPPTGGFFELGEFTNDIDNPWTNGSNPVMAPYDEDFHFVLNVAVGGAYFTFDNTSNSKPPPPWGDKTSFLDFWTVRDEWLQTWTGESQAMAVDYVRVYAV